MFRYTFAKDHATGNDFIIINDPLKPLRLLPLKHNLRLPLHPLPLPQAVQPLK